MISHYSKTSLRYIYSIYQKKQLRKVGKHLIVMKQYEIEILSNLRFLALPEQ